MSDKDYLLGLAEDLDNATRIGKKTDRPEGARWIQISDALARDISQRLREIAGTPIPCESCAYGASPW